jgi:preprotein translocase subunit SecE
MADKDKKKRVGPITFMRQVRQEGDSISWTTLQETRQATIFVMIMSVAVALFLFAADWIIKNAFILLGVITPTN